jgi:hypothetical protein
MKKAVIVVGAESSGTRFITNLVINHGYYGDSGHHQEIDKILFSETFKNFSKKHDKIVIRRSYPHAGKWPSISRIYKRLDKFGYSVIIIVTHRNWFTMAMSQLDRRSKQPKFVSKNIPKAYKFIMKHIIDLDAKYYILEFSGTCSYRTASLKWVAQILREQSNLTEKVIDSSVENKRIREYISKGFNI